MRTTPVTGIICSKWILYLIILLIIPDIYTNAQSFSLSAVSDLERVFEDGFRLPEKTDTIKLFGIRGEIISGQLLINARKGLSDLSVSLSGLINNKTGVKLKDNAIEWNFIGSVPLVTNAPNQTVNAILRPAPARFPDYLMEEKLISMKAKTYRGVWITIKIPEDADYGKYSGKMMVKSRDEEKYMPVEIMVYPLLIPSERHLKVVEWYNTSRFGSFHGISEKYSPEWFDMLKVYAENMVLHRQNIFNVPMEAIEIKKLKNNELEFDFSRFDQIANVFWNTGKMDYLETGELSEFGSEKWFSTNIVLSDFTVVNSENNEKIILSGEEVIPHLLPAFESHLREKGWLEKTFFGIKDEPAIHNALAWKEISSYMHKYAPDLKRIDAIETTFLLDEIEVAIPKLDALATWYNSYKEWEKKGNELWFYSVGIYQASLLPNKTIDMPLIDSRIMHWINYKYDAAGYLHWGWNQWTENPYEDPDIHIGDGWHVYPVKNGVLNSVRWEQMRNGIQDYEYFWMLENKTRELKDSLGSRFSWIDPKQRGKEIAGQVVKGFADHTDDPEILVAAKKQLIKEIVDFDVSPGLLVQTNPCEGSLITSGSSIEVLGWTDPATKIVVNGQELPVSPQGLFVEQFQLTAGRNSIIVQATGPKGKKEIKRTFEIK